MQGRGLVVTEFQIDVHILSDSLIIRQYVRIAYTDCSRTSY
jgi:hypothetical protein